MHDHHRRRYERGTRVRDFAETIRSAFPADSKGAQSLARIKELLERVAALDASHATSTRAAREGTSGKTEARESLRALVSQVSRTARAISLDDPALKERFRLPSGNLNAQTLIGVARSFLAEATPLKEQFVEYGMSEDFLETLAARIADYESHTTRQQTGASARIAGGAAIDSTLDELDGEVKRFDAIARNRFSDNSAILAALQSARRLERAPRVREAQPLPQPENPPA